jgi:hypothetical protein
VKRTLEFAMSTDVRSQDASTLIGSLLVKPWSSALAWEFTKERWPTLLKTLNVFQAIPDLVSSFGAFCSVTRGNEVKDFLAKNSCRQSHARRSRPSSGSTTAWRSTCVSPSPSRLARACVLVPRRLKPALYCGKVVGGVS